MEFPRNEAEIKELAVGVALGFEEAADRFPSPPVSAAELRSKLERVHGANAAAMAAEAAFRAQHTAKDDAVKELKVAPPGSIASSASGKAGPGRTPASPLTPRSCAAISLGGWSWSTGCSR